MRDFKHLRLKYESGKSQKIDQGGMYAYHKN